MKIIDGKALATKMRVELKEKIDRQILITKEKTGGSRAEIRV